MVVQLKLMEVFGCGGPTDMDRLATVLHKVGVLRLEKLPHHRIGVEYLHPAVDYRLGLNQMVLSGPGEEE
jgi:hypothetical protein